MLKFTMFFHKVHNEFNEEISAHLKAAPIQYLEFTEVAASTR